MTRKQEPRAGSEGPHPSFDPVIVRARHDGWTAERQVAFIQALAECGCVQEACDRVGMTTASAYALRARLDAQGFRAAWRAALDHAVQRLSDAAFSRAINGTATPVFFQGEQIGERRRYDERLTTFLLRYRDPARYGKWHDDFPAEWGHADSPTLALAHALLGLLKEGNRFDDAATMAAIAADATAANEEPDDVDGAEVDDPVPSTSLSSAPPPLHPDETKIIGSTAPT